MINKTQTEDTADTIRCRYCDNPAVYNFQKIWIVAAVTDLPNKIDGIPDNQSPEGDDNLVLCSVCAREEFDSQVQTIKYGDWISI